MYCNDIVATKVRTIVSNLKRKPKVRAYREVTEIAPLLTKEGQSADKFIPTTELQKIDEENCGKSHAIRREIKEIKIFFFH